MSDIKILEHWFDKNFIRFHPDIEIKTGKSGKLGVFTKKDLNPENEVFFDPSISPDEYPDYGGSPKPLVRVPKQSIFSGRNSFLSNILLDLNIRGIPALIMAFIYEYEMKEKSPWFEYFVSFGDFLLLDISQFESDPKEGDVSSEDIEDLFAYLCEESTSIENQINIPVPELFKLKPTSKAVESFTKISKLIAFKCFDIDDYHEVALVPAADLFKHSSKDSQCQFECIDTACSVCGSIDCEHLENGIVIDDILDDVDEYSNNDVSIDSGKFKGDRQQEDSDSDLDMSESDTEYEKPLTDITEEYVQKMEEQMNELEESVEDEEEDENVKEDDEYFSAELPDYLKDHKDDFSGEIEAVDCCEMFLSMPIKKNKQIFY